MGMRMYTNIKRLKNLYNLLTFNSKEKFIQSSRKIFEEDDIIDVWKELLAMKVASRIVESAVYDGLFDDNAYDNTLTLVVRNTVNAGTIKMGIEIMLDDDTKISFPLDLHVYNTTKKSNLPLGIKRISIAYIEYVETDSVLVSDVRITSNTQVDISGKRLMYEYEKLLSKFNSFPDTDRKTKMISYFRTLIGAEKHNAELIGAMYGCMFTTLETVSIKFNPNTFKYGYSCALEPTYDNMKQLPKHYLDDDCINSQLKLLMDESDYEKIYSRSKLIDGGNGK